MLGAAIEYLNNSIGRLLQFCRLSFCSQSSPARTQELKQREQSTTYHHRMTPLLVGNQEQRHQSMRTSYTEYEADALAHWADEGRGDRRNVQGELHASEEP